MDALTALARALQDGGRTVIAPDAAHAAIARADAADLTRAALDANILTTQGDDLKFAHQLLQEYFAAKVLLEKMTADEADKTSARAAALFGAAWWQPGVWRETTIILGEFLGEGAAGANRAARWLAAVTPWTALEGITRHAAGLTVADVEPGTRAALIESARAKGAESDPVGRAAAYRVLGALAADDRIGVGTLLRGGLLLPDVDWVTIPDDGEFPVGHADERDNPPQVMRLPAYQIARYPITDAQFQTFIDDREGFADARWWDGLKDDANRRQNQSAPGDQAFKFGNHPRERVSWYDAIAFCRWMSWRLGGDFALDRVDRWAVRLPTEWEWEKAARAGTGWRYPYGNEYDAAKGNTGKTGIGQTSAVGIFPGGASPYGVLDMSGNVWQWCLSNYKNPPVHETDPTRIDLRTNAQRVLRGGSWNDLQGGARASFRSRFFPLFRDSAIGFRVVVGGSGS